MPENLYETFVWKGQTRYRCGGRWESGAKCEYDTADREAIIRHATSPHTRTLPTGPSMPAVVVAPASVFDTEASAPEFKDAKFAAMKDGDNNFDS